MSNLMFFSTNGSPERVDFKQALLTGQAPDMGLYMPEYFPRIEDEEISKFRGMRYPEIAYRVISPYIGNLIPKDDLISILESAYNFDIPIERVFDRAHIMRLDRGPTCSFKDFAARLMGRLVQYFLEREGRNIIILTATSGDTGSAVAHAFYGLGNVRVVVLYPEREVTKRQRKQMTTLGGNVHALAVDGKFDECQALVKRAFADPELRELDLSSANSINVGRLLPQSVYYFYAYSRISDGEEIVVAVPSGNFGNLMGGLIAMRMGLPVRRFVVATNENDEFPVFMRTGVYKPIRPSRNCISNAMNVGHPSNLARVFALYGGWLDEKGEVRLEPDIEDMRRDMFAVSVSDDETRKTIKEVYERYKVLLEPHGAVGWAGLMRYLETVERWEPSVSLETADPAKFPEEIIRLLGIEPSLPKAMADLDAKPERIERIDGTYESLKAYLRMMDR